LRKISLSPFLDKFVLQVFLHPDDALKLVVVASYVERDVYVENLLIWGTEWDRSSLFNSPSKPTPDFWETYHCMTANCPV
jgi:hypothetical protein